MKLRLSDESWYGLTDCVCACVQFYKAIIDAVHPSGTTAVVIFSEYGNWEEVLLHNVKSVSVDDWVRRRGLDEPQGHLKITDAAVGAAAPPHPNAALRLCVPGFTH